MSSNQKIILVERTVGLPTPSTWRLEESPIPTIADGEMLVKIKFVSLDPAMRGWINDVKSYLPPVELGAVMRAGTVGEVLESKNAKFAKGTHVLGTGGVQQYVVTDGRGWVAVDTRVAPAPLYLSALGMTGMTAYFGLLDVGKPKEGEMILVSGAAGAVGSIVGQIAKIKGCKVVGIAGGPDKCSYLKDELGFDDAIDYKNENLRARIKECCPHGIDVFFDNVGGEMLDLALARINRKGRIVLCGGISQYNAEKEIRGPKNYLALLTQRGRMEGFIVLDYVQAFSQAAKEMAGWLAEGKIKSLEHIEEGIENFYPSFLKLFNGNKRGKLILKVS